MTTPAGVQFDGRLTNIAVQYQNKEMIADMVLPPTPVPNKTGVYKKYDKDERFTLPPSFIGPKGEANEVDLNVTQDSFACEDHGYSGFVSEEDIKNADAPLQPLADMVEIVAGDLLLRREKRVSDFVFAAANYPAANVLDVAGAWATLSSDVLTQLEVGMDKCFLPPNILVMGLPTWRKLARNTTILAAVKGTLTPQMISEGGVADPRVLQGGLAQFLGLSAIIVGKAKINTAKKGKAVSYADVWDGPNAGKGGAALLRVSAEGVKKAIWASHFEWYSRQTRQVAMPEKGGLGGQKVIVSESTALKVVASDVGYLFSDALLT